MAACGVAGGAWWIGIWGLCWLAGERCIHAYVRVCLCVGLEEDTGFGLFYLSQYSFETGSPTVCRDDW